MSTALEQICPKNILCTRPNQCQEGNIHKGVFRVNNEFTVINSWNQVDQDPKVTIILACFGVLPDIICPLEQTLQSLLPVKNKVDLIVVVDGEKYLKIESINKIQDSFSRGTILCSSKQTNQPAVLFNQALELIHTKYITFAWPGSIFDDILRYFLESQEKDLVYVIPGSTKKRTPYEPDPMVQYGWFQCTRLYELNRLFVSLEAIKSIGNFDEALFLQKAFDWEWMIRLSRNYSMGLFGWSNTENIISMEEISFEGSYSISQDLIHRYVIRNRQIPYDKQKNDETLWLFYNDLQKADTEEVRQYLKNFSRISIPQIYQPTPKYKVCIIGGYWEYHHNQLCFFNYLELLYGEGFATYKVLLDDIADPEEVKNSDLVIFTRCKNPKGKAIIKKCKQEGIPTLYMLDDNWFRIGKDIPEIYGDLFVKGNPEYDTFLELLSNCDGAITYNSYLYEDMKQFNPNTILFPLNIRLDHYHVERNEALYGSKEEKIIGYAGSLRYDDIAFQALSRAAKEYKVKVLLMGGISEGQREFFRECDVIEIPYRPYPLYCKVIGEIAPDILLAPIESHLTAKSKCPNKYLEIGAIGGAGIYSNIYPYEKVVKDKTNGLLVSENTIETWFEKIELLLNNSELLGSIRENAHNDIEKNYDTKKKMKEFCSMITQIIENRI